MSKTTLFTFFTSPYGIATAFLFAAAIVAIVMIVLSRKGVACVRFGDFLLAVSSQDDTTWLTEAVKRKVNGRKTK